MNLASEVKKSCDAINERIKEYSINFRKQEVSEDILNEFSIITNIINTIKSTVNDENAEEMRDKLISLQDEIDNIYLNVNSKSNAL